MRTYVVSRIKKLSFKFLKFRNKIYNFFKKNSYDYCVAIVSCDKWCGKLKDDWLIKDSLNHYDIGAELISWQDDTIDFKKYDALIIRTIWGVNNYQKEFYKWLEKLEKDKVKIFNDINTIRNNFDKKIQFEILSKYQLPIIPTIYVKKNKTLTKNIKKIYDHGYLSANELVVKPAISESGHDTFVITENDKKNSISLQDIAAVYSNYEENSNFLIQPFIEEAAEKEYDICCIGNTITHGVIRCSNVFENKNTVQYLSVPEIDKNILEIAKKILNIPEYINNLYTRIDLIKRDEEYLVMEIELVDPNLFIEFIKDKKTQKKVLNLFSQQVKNNLEKDIKKI